MALKLSNEEGYSLSVAAWLADDDYDHTPVGGPYLSVTGLLRPMRMIILNQRVKALKQDQGDDEVIDISRFIASRLGTAVHAAIENTWKGKYQSALRSLGFSYKLIDKIRINPNEDELKINGIIPVYMEQRAFKEVGKYTVGGKYDFVGNGTLEDFKSMGIYSYLKGDKDENHILQGSIYRWLSPKIITSDHILIQNIITDWSKLDSIIKKDRGYPQKRIVAKKLALMPLKETEEWVKNRIQLIDSLIDSPEMDLPRCTQKDLWQDKPIFKYYKNPLKVVKSTANFEDYSEAHLRYIQDGSVGIIKEIPGKVKRCGYCDAFDICTQKDEYIAQGTLHMP